MKVLNPIKIERKKGKEKVLQITQGPRVFTFEANKKRFIITREDYPLLSENFDLVNEKINEPDPQPGETGIKQEE